MGCQNSKVRSEPEILVAPQSMAATSIVVIEPNMSDCLPKVSDPAHHADNLASDLAHPETAPSLSPITTIVVADVETANSLDDAEIQANIEMTKPANPETVVEVQTPEDIVEVETVATEPAVAEPVAEEIVEIAVDEKKIEVIPMATKASTVTNTVRRVAFDKETMRRTAPVSTPAPHTKLTKKQQHMVQSGHKSSGRRGPVASKHSRCKAQMQNDVYLEMANAFERLLTNVNTIDAHLDSR